MLKIRKTIIIILSLTLSSCAFINSEVLLEYGQPQYKGTKINKNISFNSLEDNRNDKNRVGIMKNSYGMETADIITQQDVSLWISNSLVIELENAGFTIEKTDDNTENFTLSDDDVSLSGKVLKVFSEPILYFWSVRVVSNINVEININISGKKHSKIYNVDSEKSVIIPTANDYKESLELAVRDVVYKITNDIISLTQ